MNKVYFFCFIIFVFFLLWYFGIDTETVLYWPKKYFLLLQNYYHEQPIFFMILYFLFYIIVAALPIPGEMTTTLLGASIMGFIPTLILVSFSSALGASIAMLSARFLFRDFFNRMFKQFSIIVERGFKKEGAYYVFMLRLIPIPFFLVNITLGLTSVSLVMFYCISQLGMLPATILVAKLGAELGGISHFSDIFSPTIIVLLCLLGIFPLCMKKLFTFLKKDVYIGKV